MRKVLLMTGILIMANLNGQITVKQNQTEGYYIQKSKQQNTAGWILLLTGTVTAVGGIVGFNNSWDKDSYGATDVYGFLVLGGALTDLISIPFFINSAKSKKKAASLSFNYQSFPPSHKNIIMSGSMTIALRINFLN